MSDSDADFNRSVTVWIEGLKQGQQDAATEIWQRFFEKLVRVADRKMGNAERRVADHEDVAVSAIKSLCLGAQEGRFDRLRDRNDLWKLMVAITGMKAVDQIRRQTSQKRGAGTVRGDSIVQSTGNEVPATFEQFISSEPTPELLAMLEDEQAALMAELDDTQRQIALARLQGYSNQEIADELGISVRSVERKLGLIRDIWSRRTGC